MYEGQEAMSPSVFTNVFEAFFVAVTVSTHLCVICHHFSCLMLLFQGHNACRNYTLTGPCQCI